MTVVTKGEVLSENKVNAWGYDLQGQSGLHCLDLCLYDLPEEPKSAKAASRPLWTYLHLYLHSS